METILIAAPTHECKRYALVPYLRAVKGLRWDNCDLLLVDNSADETFSKEMRQYCADLGKPWKIDHLFDMPQGPESEEYRLGHSREEIRTLALENFDYWFSLEADVICPPETLKVLTSIARQGFDIVRHAYPARQDLTSYIDAMGCALYRTSLLKQISWIEGEKNYIGGDTAFFQWSLEKGFKICNLFNALNIVHLGS